MPKAEQSPFRFTADQRKALRRLKVIEAQIANLEAMLPMSRAVLSKTATLTELRDELQSLATAIDTAMKRMSGMLERIDPRPSLLEAWNRVLMQSFDADGDGKEIERAASALASALSVVQGAWAALPEKQRRSHAATSWPVARIHEALVRGWGAAHYPVRMGEQPNPNFATPPQSTVPDYPFSPSRNSESQFFRVVAICYAVIRPKVETSPERAIKAYMEEREERARIRHAGYGIPIPEPRPGRKVPKNGRLPSTRTAK